MLARPRSARHSGLRPWEPCQSMQPRMYTPDVRRATYDGYKATSWNTLMRLKPRVGFKRPRPSRPARGAQLGISVHPHQTLQGRVPQTRDATTVVHGWPDGVAHKGGTQVIQKVITRHAEAASTGRQTAGWLSGAAGGYAHGSNYGGRPRCGACICPGRALGREEARGEGSWATLLRPVGGACPAKGGPIQGKRATT